LANLAESSQFLTLKENPMATRFFAVNKGLAKTDVVQGSSTQSKDVEIRIDQSTNSLSKMDVLLAIEALEQYITENQWPAS
jgi:hypothetical protein